MQNPVPDSNINPDIFVKIDTQSAQPYEIIYKININPEQGNYYHELRKVHVLVKEKEKLISESFTYHEGGDNVRSIQSQRGLSLVEVLGVIAISSFVIITISSLLVSAMSTSNKQSTKSQLQQQANYILVVWRECQESGLRYTINQESPSRITFNTFEESGTTRCSQVIENVNFQYVLTLPDEDGTTVIESEEFNPKYIKYIPVEIQVKDSKNIQKPYKITTILSRL